VDSSSHSDSVDRHTPIIQATDNPDRRDVCPRGDPDNRDELVSLSQSTEVMVAEADKVAINPRSDALPVATNRPQRVRRFSARQLDCIQSHALIGRKSTRACAMRLVNNVFVSGAGPRVVVVQGGISCESCCFSCGSCGFSCGSCGCCIAMPRRRRTLPASDRDSESTDSDAGGEGGIASPPTIGISGEPSVPPMDGDTADRGDGPAPDAMGASGRSFWGAAVGRPVRRPSDRLTPLGGVISAA